MAYGYDTYGGGYGGANTPAAGGTPGWGSLASMLQGSRQNNMGGGAIGAIGNVVVGAATGNPIQVAMGAIGGLNEILAASKQRKEQRRSALQSIGQGW